MRCINCGFTYPKIVLSDTGECPECNPEVLLLKRLKNDVESVEVLESPPSCNTGAQNTSRMGLTSCIDWVSVTFKNVDTVQNIMDLLGIDINHFRESQTGGKGYLKSMRFGGITIYYEGRENMGIHVEMTGQGCRHFEKYSDFNWQAFFSVIVLLDINVTRLDLAIDDYKGYFTLKKVREKVRRASVRSRFKDSVEITKTRLKDAKLKGHTIYFGSPQSQIQIRFYDKYLEMIENGKELPVGLKFWLRTELQLRDERAMVAVLIFINNINDTGSLVAGILRNYLNFVIPDESNKNKSRWQVCPWWTNFLGDVDGLKLTLKQPDNSIERSYDWLDYQVETTLAMMYEAFNQDMTVFNDLINKGIAKLEKKHFDVIDRFKKENNEITYDDFKKKLQKNRPNPNSN